MASLKRSSGRKKRKRTVKERPKPRKKHRASSSKSRASQADKRARRVWARVRRGETLAKAARAERSKADKVRKILPQHFFQTGRGKQWKAVRPSTLVTVPTKSGPLVAPVPKAKERTLLSRYLTTLRKWRAGLPGAEAELAQFAGQKVGGHALITDTRLLTTLEEAGRNDFEQMYVAAKGGS